MKKLLVIMLGVCMWMAFQTNAETIDLNGVSRTFTSADGLIVAKAYSLTGCDDRRLTVAVSPNGAVRTPEAAREAVRRLKARFSKGGRAETPIEVVFADGTYSLEMPLELTAEDSGTAVAPIVWRAANRGKAIFTAAMPLEWRPLVDEKVRELLPPIARDKVVVADVPGTGTLPSFLNGSHYTSPSNDIPVELFVGAERLVCARGPNEGFYQTGECDSLCPGVGERAKTGASFAFDPEKLAVWAREPFPWTFGLWGVYWADLRAPLDHIDLARGRIRLDDKGYVMFGLKEDMPFYVFNAFCELDRPGEWVVDRARRKVYLWPKGDEAAEMVLQKHIMSLNGVRNLIVDGIAFEKSRRTAVTLESCEDVTIRACTIRHTCSWGVEIKDGRRCRIAGCDLFDLGEGGIRLEGGNLKALERADHVAENNNIGHYGKVFYNYRQGIALYGVGNSAIHNLVHHSPHTGIYAQGNDHYIGWNVIHDTCSFNDDAGAIYVWNLSFVRRGVMIEHNVIHMTGKRRFPSNTEGIYLDDYSPENVIRYNFINRANLGVNLGGGQCNETYGNVFLNCSKSFFLSSRAHWPCSKGGRKSSNFIELDADMETYSSEKWLSHYPGLRKLLAFKGDDVAAHHAYWNVVSNNLSAYSGEAGRLFWEVISNTTVWADNICGGKIDPGLVDYENFRWTAKPGSSYASIINGCRTDAAGLYASSERLTPPVRFAPDVTKPLPWGDPQQPPIIRVLATLEGPLPDGVSSFATNTVSCSVPGWAKGCRVDRSWNCPLTEKDVWRTCTYSFVPTMDADFRLTAMGSFSPDVMTTYDKFVVTGVEDSSNLFPKEQPFEASDAHSVLSRVLKCRKGERVTVSFRAGYMGDL